MSGKFPISSDYLELMCALEQAGSLEQLAQIVCREKSVVSKRLKNLSLIHPEMIEKKNRKWILSELGNQVVVRARLFCQNLNSLIPNKLEPKVKPDYLLDSSVLMLINPQKAYLNKSFGQNSNLNAVQHISLILECWRKLNREVIFVKHESTNPDSFLAPTHELGSFIPELEPRGSERIFKKQTASAFADIDIKNDLDSENWSSIVLVGFTAAECIDATARDAHENGLEAYVVADAIDTPGLVGPAGDFFHSNLVLGVTLANLHKGIAKILDTKTLIQQLS